MARKYEMITELYRQSLQEITSRPESWTAFLRSACRNYRLPFDEQVLVHAQRRTLLPSWKSRGKTAGTSGLDAG